MNFFWDFALEQQQWELNNEFCFVYLCYVDISGFTRPDRIYSQLFPHSCFFHRPNLRNLRNRTSAENIHHLDLANFSWSIKENPVIVKQFRALKRGELRNYLGISPKKKSPRFATRCVANRTAFNCRSLLCKWPFISSQIIVAVWMTL